MAKLDPISIVNLGPLRVQPQPKYMRRWLAENRGSIAPDVQRRLAADIQRYRQNARIPRIDLPETPGIPVEGGTVAVLRTDIPGLDGRPIGGASPEALPARLKGSPGTTGGNLLRPVNPISKDHAEHVALENLRAAIEGAIAASRLKRDDLKGRHVIMLVEQEPCPSCASGLDGSGASPGVIRQFSQLYPELTIEVRNLRTSRSYVIRSGAGIQPP